MLPPLVSDGGIDLPQYLQQKEEPNWEAVFYEAPVLMEEDSSFTKSLKSCMYTNASIEW